MFRTIWNYFREPYRCGTCSAGSTDWLKVFRVVYPLCALVAFGHNYNHYPIAARQYVYCEPPNEKEKCTQATGGVALIDTTVKALITGALWPLYLSIEVQGVKK